MGRGAWGVGGSVYRSGEVMDDESLALRVLARFATERVPVWNRKKRWRTRVSPKTLKENPGLYEKLSPVDLEKPRKRLPPKGHPAKPKKPLPPDRPDWPDRPRNPRNLMPAPTKKRRKLPIGPKPPQPVKPPKVVPPARIPGPAKPRRRLAAIVVERFLRNQMDEPDCGKNER